MKSFIRKKLPFIMIAVQAVMIIGILLYIVPGRYRLYDIVLYDAAESMPANPMIGYAPPAESQEDCQNTNLVFIKLPFSELEPQKGNFDFESIEKKYHIADYRAAGKHAVIRFVCDIPGEKAHRDIPDWLYEMTGDGAVYDDESGKGYSPDYANTDFIEAHGEALIRLAEWCGRDSFVSYVEMGSVGQNGLWTSGNGDQVSLAEDVAALYARQYSEAFYSKDSIRLMSCPGSAPLEGAGSWNDALGDKEETDKWISERIQSPTAKTEVVRRTVDNSGDIVEEKTLDDYIAEGTDSPWMRGPVGGGLTEKISMDNLLMEDLSELLLQIRNSHVSFIGPVCPDAKNQDTNGSGMILRNVGYCIYLSRLQTTVDFIDDNLLFAMSFTNIGNAPFYWDWPVTMYVFDRHREIIQKQELNLSLSQLQPGSTITVTGTVPYSRSLLRGYSVGVSITSPDDGNFLTMAQKGVTPKNNGIHMIYKYRGTRNLPFVK